MGLRWHTVVVDCLDVEAQAAWWAEVMDWRRLPAGEDVVIVPAAVADGAFSGSPDDRGPLIIFVPSDAPRRSKSRLHLDLAPREGSTQRAEVDRLLGLGATPVDIGQGPDVPWVVLADPEGNEFCVLSDGMPWAGSGAPSPAGPFPVRLTACSVA